MIWNSYVNQADSFSYTLRIIGPSKLAILRILPWYRGSWTLLLEGPRSLGYTVMYDSGQYKWATKKPLFPLYWLVYRDPYDWLIKIPI